MGDSPSQPFQLSDDAVCDIDAVWLHLVKRTSIETADRIAASIFEALYEVARLPASGHRRPDLTAKRILFFRVFSYLIIYVPDTKPLRVIGVLHGKRNVARILRQRKAPD